MHSILNNDSSNCLSSNSNSQMSIKSSKLPSLLTSHSSSSTNNYTATNSGSNLPKKKSGLPMKGCINASNNKIATPISTNSLVNMNNNQSQSYQQQQCSQALNSINKLHQISKIQQPQTTNNQQTIDTNKPPTKYVHISIIIIRLDFNFRVNN
jgi:hypothetical protein